MAINNLGEKLFIKDVPGANYLEGIKKRTSDASQDVSKDTSRGDTVTLSSDSRGMNVAREAVMAAPPQPQPDQAREQKVSELRSLYLAGNYRVEPEKVAEKLIGTYITEIV